MGEMTEQEIAYLKLRGWTPKTEQHSFWISPYQDHRHFFWGNALDEQMERDQQELIDAYLRLPALEAAVNELIANSWPGGEGDDAYRCVDHGDYNVLCEVTNG